MKSGARRLGLYGFEPHAWQSVDRTRRFYLDSLAPHFELAFVGETERPPDDVGAVLVFSGFGGWRSLSPAGVPYLFAVHGGATLDHAALRENAERLRATDTFIVNCRSDETILKRLFAGETPRFCRLPLPANPACSEDVTQEQARAALPFDEPPDLIIGFVARLLPQKNLHLFLRMLAALSARLRPRRVQAVVVGEYWADYPVLPYMTREYREYVAGLSRSLGVAASVLYLGGGLPDEDLRLVYGALDLLIHPTWSIDENFGYVPVEAMACGVPVLGTRYGGLKDTVVHGETGFLMPCWATASGIRVDWVGGIEHAVAILTAPGLRARLSGAAMSRARAEYSDRRCAAKLVSAVADAFESPGPSRRLEAAPLEATRRSSGYLPPLEVGWEYYWPSVESYAGPLPDIRSDSRLQLFAPARFEDNVAEFLDPAWPARIPLNEEERRVCIACESVTSAASLGAQDAILRGLLEKGALIVSNRER